MKIDHVKYFAKSSIMHVMLERLKYQSYLIDSVHIGGLNTIVPESYTFRFRDSIMLFYKLTFSI